MKYPTIADPLAIKTNPTFDILVVPAREEIIAVFTSRKRKPSNEKRGVSCNYFTNGREHSSRMPYY